MTILRSAPTMLRVTLANAAVVTGVVSTGEALQAAVTTEPAHTEIFVGRQAS